MGKDVPCYGCEKRRAENGYNCHSDCPDYKVYKQKREDRAEMIRKKRAEEAMVNSVHIKAVRKQKKKNDAVKYWKG